MDSLTQSFLCYSGFAALIGGIIHSRGRERAKLANYEYLFLLLPWLSLVAMAVAFYGSTDYFGERTGIWSFFWIMQSIGAGMMAGFVLMPRYFVKAETFAAKMLVNLASAMAVSLIFLVTRFYLFALSSPFVMDEAINQMALK